MEKSSTLEFINKSIQVHVNKYDYSEVEYINCKVKVSIKCKQGHIFEQAPSKHLIGHGCTFCNTNYTKTNSEFLLQCKEVHEDKYDYSNTSYKTALKKVKIICKEHGEFSQFPNNHLAGKGCPTCSNNQLRPIDDFIEIASIIHENKYTYENVIYNKHKGIINITCKKHGSFMQSRRNHLSGQGCPTCNEELHRGVHNIRLSEKNKEEWLKIPATIYFLHLYSEYENFYKVGITSLKRIKDRFVKAKIPYKHRLVTEIRTSLYLAVNWEAKIIEANKKLRYKPMIKFSGHTECFSSPINMPFT